MKSILPLFLVALIAVSCSHRKISTQPTQIEKKPAAVKGKDFKLALGKGVEMELVWVEAGYWVGKYEVTQEEYEAVIGSNPSMYPEKRRPVERVSWDDAMEFCKNVTVKQRENGALPGDWVVTLPTEKQWEYFVADAKLDDAVFGRWKPGVKVQEQTGSASVGSKGANRLGLYDVRGNVWEWCEDWYDGKKETHVLRGTAWSNDHPINLDVSYRFGRAPNIRIYTIGFRVVSVNGGGR